MPSGSGEAAGGLRKTRLIASAFLAAQAAALVLFGSLIPPGSPFFPRCAFHALTGLHCPGCGTGRGILSILRGDVLGGLRQNWLLAAGLPFLALADVNAVLALFGRKPLVDVDRIKGAPMAAAVVIVLYWILRNLPFYPFTLLAPRPA